MRKKHKRLKKSKDDDPDTEILSQAEIDELLTAINFGNTAAEEEKKASRLSEKVKKIRIYDFKRPDKFSRDQIRSFSIIHETAARSFSINLSKEIGTEVVVHIASVDQLTFEEFVRSIPTPTSLGSLKVRDSCRAVIEIDPAVTFKTIEAAFGGSNEKPYTTLHELTDLERYVMGHVFDVFCKSLDYGWKDFIDVNVVCDGVETNPQFLRTTYPTDMVVMVTMEVKLLEAEGTLNVVYPSAILDVCKGALDRETLYNRSVLTGNKKVDVRDVPVTVRAAFDLEKTVRETIGLEVGAVWKLPNPSLFVGNKKASRCKLGRTGSSVAVELRKRPLGAEEFEGL